MGKKFINSILFFIISCSLFAAENYYVKVDGTGDGSSWEKAMSAEKFALKLSTQSTLGTGDTFHLAAGTYHPMYDPAVDHTEFDDYDVAKKQFAYYIQTPVNIIGGYSANPTNEEIPNPSINQTIISGDLNDDDIEGDLSTNKSDNTYNLFFLDLKEKKDLSFYGLTLIGTNYIINSVDGAFRLDRQYRYSDHGTRLKIDRCNLKDLSRAFSCTNDNKDEIQLQNSTFENVYYNYFNFLNASINSCTFIKNVNQSFSIQDLSIKNCTFYECMSKMYVNEVVSFHNNTTEGESVNFDFQNSSSMNLSLIGNIFDSEVSFYIPEEVFNYNVVSKYNIYKSVDEVMEDLISENTNYYPSSPDDIFEKDYRGNVLLNYNYGYTKTIKLTDDKLKGKSIRFDQSETNLEFDQRGVSRFDRTCMGSYEKRDTIVPIGKDTIIVGGEYYDKKYDKIGVYKVFVPSEDNNYDVEIRTLIVLPTTDQTTFYVKTDGKGDGSSWNKAMSPEDFALRFYLTQTIDTFHLAEGTYYPDIVADLESKTYKRTQSFTLIGGYQKDITDEQEKPDPFLYPTILSVDFEGNTDLDPTTYKLKNSEDDSYGIMDLYFYDNKDAKFRISGIVFEGGRVGMMGKIAQCGIQFGEEFTFDNCVFKNGYCSVDMISVDKNSSVTFNNCYFYQIAAPILTNNYCKYNSCTFERIWDRFHISSELETAVTNCTMLRCIPCQISYVNSDSKINFFSNTIYLPFNGNAISIESYNTGAEIYFKGNIIHGGIVKSSYVESLDFVKSSYNIYTDDVIKKSTDFVADDEEFSNFLSSKTDASFMPPVLPLKKDSLSDGTSLRFSRYLTDVTKDQKGDYRSSMTCMGSYEIFILDTVSIYKKDTIHVGEQFENVTYEEIGIYDSIYVLVQGTSGRDSIVERHTLCVLPKDKQTTFYVKVDGKGNGSSWEDAMSPEDFALRFCLTETIDTFYVAEGTYHPIEIEDKALFYQRNYPVTLIGGYRKEITDEQEKPDPTQYKTIFSGDLLKNNEFDTDKFELKNTDDDLDIIVKLNLPYNSDDNALISGIIFEGGRKSYGGKASSCQCQVNNGKITFDKCEFRNCSNEAVWAYTSFAKATFNNCYFYQVGINYTAEYNSCTFERIHGIFIMKRFGEKSSVINCTMIQCMPCNLDLNKKTDFVNNTISMPKDGIAIKIDNYYEDSELNMIGNIIQGSIEKVYSEKSFDMVKSSYNVYSEKPEIVSETDIIVEDFSSFLASDTIHEKGVFTPVLALNRDVLSDGTELRFPRDLTSLMEDQRGVIRPAMTNMGSYELFKTDTLPYLKNDTILVGGQFEGLTYEKIGVYDSIMVVLPDMIGRDSLVEYHKLYVIPTGKQTTFYVKTKGKGDGSSWDNAMSPEDFAWQLALSQTTDTFHVAAGTYYPITTTSSTKQYERKYPFSLIGGYPSNIMDETQKPDPINNNTILSVDFNNNNVYNSSTNEMDQTEDDGVRIILYQPIKQGNSFISGIVFNGGRCITGDGFGEIVFLPSISDSINLTIENCEFKNGCESVTLYRPASISMKNCYFYHVLSPLSYGEIDITSCTFEECEMKLRYYNGSISNCTMFNLNQLEIYTPQGLNFYNNSVYSPSNEVAIVIDNSIAGDLNLKGNIIQGTIKYNEEKTNLIHSSYNLFSQQDTFAFMSATDLFTKDFSSLFNDEMEKEDGVFTPLLALKRDVLSDGSELRFPRDVTSLMEDQRGMVRPAMTNMGSYEMFKTDTVFLFKKDTIHVGGQFEGLTYEKIGIYDSIKVVLQDVSGRDSLVEYHTLCVLPTGNQTTFYVKKEGTGDGSSWKNAMSPEDFALRFRFTETVDTFHVAEGTYHPIVMETPNSRNYERTYPFMLIGGYRNEITDEEEKPDPSLYKTVLSVDFNGDNKFDEASNNLINVEEDDYYVMTYYSNVKDIDDNVFVSGIVFEGGKKGYGGDSYIGQFKISHGDKFTFEKCEFRNGYYLAVNSTFGGKSIIFNDCYFYQVRVDCNKAICYNSCTFENIRESFYFSSNKDNAITVSNCTMLNSITCGFSSGSGTMNFVNNTIAMPKNGKALNIRNYDENIEVNMIGNIIQGSIGKTESEKSLDIVKSSYNVYSEESEITSANDIVTEDFSTFLASDTTHEKGVFTPLLALKRDELSDGTQLRFSRLETLVSRDQRGVGRSLKTCMGSYEIPINDTVTLDIVDTIKVGETFAGKTYDKLGIYEDIPVVLTNISGRDSVVLHKVCVIPTGKQTTFYVKIKGKGDGSSWKEAMSPEQFAWQMALSQNVDTFHVAEGTYHPIEINNSKVYTRSAPFVLKGGYDDDVTDEKTEPDPVHYETILSADFNNDDFYDSSTGEVKNIEDDGSVILSYTATEKTNSLIYGIVFHGGKAGGFKNSEQCQIFSDLNTPTDFTFEKCEFRDGAMSAISYASSGSLYFNNCYFLHTPSPTAYGDLLSVTSSTFEGCNVNFYSKETVTISNCSMFDLANFNITVPENSQMNYYNNTIYSPSKDVPITFKKHEGELNLIGNIIHGIIEFDAENVSHIHSAKNIFTKQSKTDGYKSAEDFFIDDISYFLDDNLSPREEDLFTPVFVLKHDTFANGSSIRFPLSETNLLTDQRGVNRADLTCPGVYEIACRDVEKHLPEIEYYSIVNQPEEYNFETCGLHEFVERKKCRCGSDSIIYHTVYIAPSSSKKTYYVTTTGSGTGDGSSWENAINDTSFAYLFANAQGNVTFYMEEGTYYPIEMQGLRTYQRSYPFTLMGGYRKGITDEEEEADPILYKTILSVDFDGDNTFDTSTNELKNTDEDSYAIVKLNYTNKKDAEVLFSGIVFDGGRPGAMGRVAQCELTYGNTFTFNQCEFRNGYGSIESFIGVENIIFNNCYFHHVGGPVADVNHSVYNACTFNRVYDRLGITAIGETSVSNCTMIQCAPCSFYLMNSDATLNFINNSVCMPQDEYAMRFSTYIGGKLNLTGNLIQGPIEKPNYIENVDFVNSSYNVYATNAETMSDSDIFTEEFSSFLASDTTHEENVFTPILALKNDKLSDGTSLRFPLIETSVEFDQRGIVRPTMTNMGSYELVKNDTVILEKMDSIRVGEQFEGVTYNKLGIYDSIAIVKHYMEDRDSVILHTLCVIPTGEQTTFYVKTNGEGDGSSWEEAMSPDQFAWQMTLSQTVDTFHVAEGTYYPIETKRSYNRSYYRTMPFRLIGGYRNAITDETEEANPVQNKTILSVDFNNNNTYIDGYVANSEDDGYGILYFNSPIAGESSISGIVFEGGAGDMHCTNAQCQINNSNYEIDKFTFEQCEFKSSRCRSIRSDFDWQENPNGHDVLNINQCHFNRVGEYFYLYPVQHDGIGSVNINACAFTEFHNFSIYALSNQTVTYSNCTMYDCDFITIETGSDSTAKINFINNTVYSSTNLEQSIFKVRCPANINFTGNIIQTDLQTETSDLSGIRSKYNVFNEETSMKFETDITTNDFSFLEDTISRTKDIVAPIIVLKSDSIDGVSLRFPRLENVTTDQRGAIRAYETCRGSYELVKNDTVILDVIDTIRVGEQFDNVTYNKLGIYEGVEVVLHTVGRDSIVVHTLCVIPTGEQTTFYVKTNGDGDGSSWEEAMSPDQFAWQMALSQTTDTFHVAEGTYYPIETKYKDEKSYNRTTPFRLIGGYQKEITDETEEADPVHNKTILSVDFNNNNKYSREDYIIPDDLVQEDSHSVLYYEPTKKGTSSISGIVFEGGKLNKQNAQCEINRKVDLDLEVGEVNFDQCEFRNTNTRSIIFYCGNKSVQNINNCYFNNVDGPILTGAATTNLNGCTFEGRSYYIAADFGRKIKIANSTMYDCGEIGFHFTGDTTSVINFVNNTVYSSSSKDTTLLKISSGYPSTNLYLTGNILQANVKVDKDTQNVHSNYNIYYKQLDIDELKSETDLSVKSFSSFMDNKISFDENVVTPVMVMTSDTLSNGTSLRFPRTVSNLQNDQRGAVRPKLTCIGAYEAGCKPIEIHLTDLEYISSDNLKSKYGVSYDTMGRYMFVEEQKCICGSDSIVYHDLYITPSLNETKYFVKVDGSGKGDGSSWENAMNDTSFSYILANAKKNGVTYYMAAGTYTPIYSKLSNDSSSTSNKIFYTEKSFNIKGGYSKKSTSESYKKNTRKFVTIFANNEDSKDNSTIMKIKNASSSISGVKFHGVKTEKDTLLSISSNKEVSVKVSLMIDSCQFEESGCGIYADNVKLKASNSVFVDNIYSLSILNKDHKDTTQVTSSLFSNNSKYAVDASVNGTFILLNSTFYNNDSLRIVKLNDNYMSEYKIYNNTFLNKGMTIQPRSNSLKLVGNIILNLDSVGTDCISKNNLLREGVSFEKFSNKDLFVSDFKDILEYDDDYVLNSSNTVAMVNDTLPKTGQWLRYMRDSIIVTDQRGVKRNEMCCIGAYEKEFKSKPCDTIVTVIEDTINAGETYLDQLYEEAGSYIAQTDTFLSIRGCDSIVIIRLEVLPVIIEERPIPTAFTPYDKNGKNDVFMPEHEVYIYDVYGMLLTHSSNGWDGKVNDEFVRPGVYVYAVVLEQGTLKKGTIEVLVEQ